MLQSLFDGTLEHTQSIGAVDEFLAIISHELRIPISAILGWTEVLVKHQHDQTDFSKAVEIIRSSALVQAQLIDQLTDYSTLGINKLALNIGVVSLAKIVKAAVETLAPLARKRQIHVEVQLGLSEAEMNADFMRLQQVFSNLLSNAIKFTPGGGNVRVTLESSDDSHIAKVSDTGEGIRAEFLPFVFDRYRQADGATAKRGGLGLGLTIARHIVELHRGTIEAESSGKGEGATFIVQLPRGLSPRTDLSER